MKRFRVGYDEKCLALRLQQVISTHFGPQCRHYVKKRRKIRMFANLGPPSYSPNTNKNHDGPLQKASKPAAFMVH